MTRIELAPEITDDFDRVFDHIARHGEADAVERIAYIIEAINVLQHSPRIGRPARDDLHELVIGKDQLGYVALYRYIDEINTAFILAIRCQHETGYKC